MQVSRSSFLWVLIATGGISLCLSLATIGYIHKTHVEIRRIETRVLAQGYAQRIQERLQSALISTHVLASYVKQSDGQISNFNENSAELLSLFPNVSALQLAPDGVIREIYPLEGNETAIGHDLLADKKRNREAMEAINKRQLTLAGPFELIQGGVGTVGRLPIFLTNERKESHFWGFAIALVRISSLIESSGLSGLSKAGYRYELWRTHPDTGERHVFSRSHAEPLDQPAEYVITIFNGNWILSLMPEDGWTTQADYAEIIGLSLLSSLIITLLQYMSLIRLLRNPRTPSDQP
jgi:sensor domain CHASE-containing protein